MIRKNNYFIGFSELVISYFTTNNKNRKELVISSDKSLTSTEIKQLAKIDRSLLEEVKLNVQVQRSNDPNYYLNLQQVIPLKLTHRACLNNFAKNIFLKLNRKYTNSQEIISNMKKSI